MSHEAGREGLATATGRCSCANHREFLNVLKLVGLPIIVAFLINELPEKFNWWLCSIELLLRHVDIVDENQALSIALDRAKHILALLLELRIDVGLSDDAVSLRGEVDFNRSDRNLFIGSSLLDEALNDHSLAGTRCTRDEDRLVDSRHDLEQIAGLLSLYRWHDELEEGSGLERILKLRHLRLVVLKFEM